MENNSMDRAKGAILGQLAGDALGSLVEFQSKDQIYKAYPQGVRTMVNGGTWKTIAGQPTDDSEMALLLARMLVEKKIYDADAAKKAYVYWLNSGPFDCGMTISAGLSGRSNPDSQANGAMMRISPLGIFGSNYSLDQVAQWARQDAELTHPHPVCLQANALFAMAIAHGVKTIVTPQGLYEQILMWAKDMDANMDMDKTLMIAIENAAFTRPMDYVHHQGWVLIAFQNALWQLVHAENFEEGIVDTIMQGGDTDTNAAICGALLGAVHGEKNVPSQWVDCLLKCRPEAGNPHVRHPRPKCFWPVDALDLAEKLADQN